MTRAAQQRSTPPTGPTTRVHLVAYDVCVTSTAQPRKAALARQLAKRGLPVELWTATDPGDWAHALPNLTTRIIPDPISNLYRRYGRPRKAAPAGGPEQAAGWLRSTARAIQRKLLFPDNERIWSSRVARRLTKQVAPGDVVITCTRPESVGLIGQAAAQRGAFWWFDLADGWCFQGLRTESMEPGPRRNRELALEKTWIRAADMVTTVNEDLRSYYSGVRGREAELFPNIVADDFLEAADERPARKPETPLTIGYLGRLSLSDRDRSLAPFVRMIEAQPEPGIRFVFLGEYGARDLEEIHQLEEFGHEVQVRAPVARAKLLEIRRELDGLLMVSSPEQLGASSKLLDSFGLRRPVFVMARPESRASQLVLQASFGEAAPLDDPREAGVAWRRFLAQLDEGEYHIEPSTVANLGAGASLPRLLDLMQAGANARQETAGSSREPGNDRLLPS